MKRTLAMSILSGLVLVAGITGTNANPVFAGDASDRGKDTFLNYIDPSPSADFNNKLLCAKGPDSNAKPVGEGAVRNKETLLNYIDPSHSADFGKATVCTGEAVAINPLVAKDTFLNYIGMSR